MKLVYLSINGDSWEDMIIFLTEEEAIEASFNNRVEIFSKNTDMGYLPTYNYYKNGELYKYCNKQ